MSAFSAIADAAEAHGAAPLPPLPKALPEAAQARPEHKDAADPDPWKPIGSLAAALVEQVRQRREAFQRQQMEARHHEAD